MIRKIIQIDEEKCSGCGACASACHEGAIGMVDGKAVTRVLDADGAVSALKPEELQKEFLSNDRFSAIVVASRASGSGAGGGRKGGGATSKRLSEMSATEEAKFANEKPAEYQQMLAAEQG